MISLERVVVEYVRLLKKHHWFLLASIVFVLTAPLLMVTGETFWDGLLTLSGGLLCFGAASLIAPSHLDD